MVLVMRGNEVVIKERYAQHSVSSFMNMGSNRTFATRRRFAPSALRNLVVFSILMMIVPITTYFAARNFYIGMNEPNDAR
jgi:hypothetical protein